MAVLILNLEEIIIKCAETDKNDSVDVYRTMNFIGKNRLWFEENISDTVELFFGKPLA